MRKIIFLLLMMLPAGASLLINAANDKPRRVFLMAGQSNADGRVAASGMPADIREFAQGGSRYCFWSYCNGKDWAWDKYGGKLTLYKADSDNQTARCGFDAVVYHLIEKALSERFYVIKESLGGTAIDTRCTTNSNLWWCADPEWLKTASPRSGHSLALEFTENIGACIDNVLSKLQEGYEIQCIMWHQGESDRTRPFDYEQNLSTLVAYLRSYLVQKTGQERYANLPFIAGTVNRKSTQYNSIVEDAQWRLAHNDPNFHVVDFSDCQLGSDVLHFDADGCVTCGKRMFNKLVRLGLVEADTVEVPQAPADTLRLTKDVIQNYDYEYYETKDGLALNDGSARKDGQPPYGWQHAWAGSPSTAFPSSTYLPNYGISGTATGLNGKSHAFYIPWGAMPANFELYQEIPAGTLPAGTYRLSCRLGQNIIRAGVTRIFANNQVQYFGAESRYNADVLAELYPGEITSFAGHTGTSIDVLHEMSVTVTLKEGEPLRFGIRSSNLNNRGATTTISEMGAFTVDYWRLVRQDDASGFAPISVGRGTVHAAMYDLSGRRIPAQVAETRGLPKGIYIIDGRKVVF